MKRYALLSLVLVLTACHRNAPELDSYGFVPEFRLTAQDGQPFDSKTLTGKIWVADFIFTNCPGPCPGMTAHMQQVHERVQDVPDVQSISFSVDPARDTPAALAAYAKAHHASHERWSFLTGPQSTLNDLCRNVFKLGNVDGSLAHSTRFVLIDRKSQIRGYYDTSEPDSIGKLVSDVHALARERS